MRNDTHKQQNKHLLIKLFWYCSLILALFLLVFGFIQGNVVFAIVSLIIGVSFRYFGDFLVFDDINKRIERRLSK